MFLLCLFCVLSFLSVTCIGTEQKKHVDQDRSRLDKRSTHMDFQNIRAISFVICRSDPICAKRFYIDRKTFDINQFRYLFNTFVDENENREYLINNFQNDSVKKAWLRMMRMASFCSENEIPDSSGYCICKNGKICDEKPASVFNGDSFSFTMVFIVLIVITVYYSAVHLSAIRTIHDNSEYLMNKYYRKQYQE